MLLILVGSGLASPIVSYTSSSAFAATVLKGNVLKGKIVSVNGKPIAGAQVQLISPAKTMMDVTTTGQDGKYTIDLGVLDNDEMKKLNKFSVVVSKKGKKVNKILTSGASSAKGVINVENIELH